MVAAGPSGDGMYHQQFPWEGPRCVTGHGQCCGFLQEPPSSSGGSSPPGSCVVAAACLEPWLVLPNLAFPALRGHRTGRGIFSGSWSSR